jgi:hypothetical protein
MAKVKKPKLTAEDNKRLEQCFRQLRDQTLRQWYDEAHGEDPQLQSVAQARLQLQVDLRERRKEIALLKQDRDISKINGDTDELAATRKKLKRAQFAMAMQSKILVDGIPIVTAAKARKQWVKTAWTLAQLLDNFDLDKKTEFGLNRDILRGLIVHEKSEDESSFEGGPRCINGQLKDGVSLEDGLEHTGEALRGVQLEDQGTAETLVDEITEVTPNPTCIWTHHALEMQKRYRSTNLPDFAIETKLAFQKKLFDQHVDRERQLQNAVESTLALSADGQHAIREGTSTTWNPVLVTSTYSEHSLWELTSPLLWQSFEGGLSWNYPQWVPSGIMRIQTALKLSHIYFDFGTRTFSTQRLFIPSTISTGIVIIPATCHQTDANIDIGITFLAQGFVKVSFPVLAIIQPDLGCKDPPFLNLDLTGVWLGPVE